jgi:hypothetical protein
MARRSVDAARPYCFVKHSFTALMVGRAIALATAAATGSMPELMVAVFGDTRVSARVAKNQKTARCPARASP